MGLSSLAYRTLARPSGMFHLTALGLLVGIFWVSLYSGGLQSPFLFLLGLLVLLAYQLQVNWQGVITLFMAVDDEETSIKAIAFLQRLIRLARLPENTEIQVEVGPFDEVLAAAPAADLNLFGLAPEQDVSLAHEIVDVVQASCLFVRDSGDESALA